MATFSGEQIVDFFDRFTWAVPTAFSDALAKCKFEEGDVLFESKSGYSKNWNNYSNFYLQVRYPTKGQSVKTSSKRSVFLKHWDSDCRVELYKNRRKVVTGHLDTSQGRLYSLLWTGDLTVLDPRCPNPEPPILANKVAKLLYSSTNELDKYRMNNSATFVMPYDLSNKVSWLKFRILASRLRKKLAQAPFLERPDTAGISLANRIAPTVQLAVFATQGLSENDLYEAIKAAVYKPAKDTKNPKFRIQPHGIII